MPSPSASLDAQLLLGHVMGLSRAQVLAFGERELTPEQWERYELLLEERRTGTPLAYLRGWIEWHGTEYGITRDVLVPRPETELLLEQAVQMARASGAWVIADVGTGSGVLATQLAVALPEARVYGVDVSRRALSVAQQNVRRLGVEGRVRLLHGSLLEPLPEEPDIIVANLPYLSDEMMASLDAAVRAEPALALHGGESGLELYAAMLRQVRDRKWMSGIVFEIDPRQGRTGAGLARDVLPGREVRVLPDYAGLDRIIEVGAGAR